MRRAVYILLAILFGAFAAPAFAQVSLPGPSAGAAIPGTGTKAPTALTSHMPTTGEAVITDDSYRLGTGDKMKVTVYGEDDLSGEFVIDGSGQVQYPLIGQVNAAGMTIHEFVAELTTQLGAKYLRSPKVSVQIENYRPFYIIGEVNKPGEYPFENGLNALGAVALAGGYTYRADDRNILVRRSGSNQEQTLPANGSTKIYPGDVVRVAERIF